MSESMSEAAVVTLNSVAIKITNPTPEPVEVEDIEISEEV